MRARFFALWADKREPLSPYFLRAEEDGGGGTRPRGARVGLRVARVWLWLGRGRRPCLGLYVAWQPGSPHRPGVHRDEVHLRGGPLAIFWMDGKSMSYLGEAWAKEELWAKRDPWNLECSSHAQCVKAKDIIGGEIPNTVKSHSSPPAHRHVRDRTAACECASHREGRARRASPGCVLPPRTCRAEFILSKV